MKWVLVVLIGGVTPVTTDVTFEKLADCLAAEVQLRQTYAEAYAAMAQKSESADWSDRRRARYRYRERGLDTRKFANTGTCIPHAGTDQPITSLGGNDQSSGRPAPASAPPPTSQQ